MKILPYILFFFGILTHNIVINHNQGTKNKIRIVEKEYQINKRRALPATEVQVLKPNDRSFFIDCSDESRNYGWEPIVSYKFLELFSGKTDPLNGLLQSNNFPLFIHLRGQNNANLDSPVFFGFRGDTAGIHRSLITPPIFKIYQENPQSIMLLPGSFVKISETTYQSVCHRRNYPNVGYIGSQWPALRGKSWEVYNKLLGHHGRIFMFAYSNGGVARDEYLLTNSQYYKHVAISDAFEFSHNYADASEFLSPDVDLINGIVDIETNYSKKTELWNLTKFLHEFVENNPKKIYYAACSLESPVTMTHVYLINAMNMVGEELYNGVIRYKNSMRNIIIDILTLEKTNPYSYKNVDLQQQTLFLPNKLVTHRLHTGHYKIVAYAVNQFNLLAKERKVYD